MKIVALIGALGGMVACSSAGAQSFQAEQLLHANPCSWPEGQQRFIDGMNQAAAVTAAHGKLVSIKDAETVYVNLDHNDVECRGKLTYADGSVHDSGFNIPPPPPRSR